VGHMLANVFLTGAFFIYLGSAQPVFDQVFDRSSQFAVFFALSGVVTVPPLILNNRLIKRYGARRMSMLACSASAAIAVAAVVPTLVLDGRPSFWLWYVWVLFVTSLLTLATPSITALALEPMGALAGTASSLLFFSGFAFGAVLAALFDRLVDDTVTPFVVGFALYTSIGLTFLWWAGGTAALSSESK
ncbi:MAG: DHA1 family bicyclomycin/chloramphenicol resistance-like MFS transporter, partial [Paracrocinitomix sp.]